MSSQRGELRRIGGRFLAASFVFLAAVTGSAFAQPGFGPDPFWPYNSQYTPYARPVGPAEPVGGGAMRGNQAAFRGANQFQDYLDNLQGSAGRNSSDRATVGTPYYRSSVNPDFSLRGRAMSRQYQPNSSGANASFDMAQRRAAEKYFAYFSERDPARRRELRNEYRDARRDASRALHSRVRPPSALTPSRGGTGGRDAARMGIDASADTGAAGRSASARRSRIGPAPAIDSDPSGRALGSTRRRGSSSPSAVLERSQAMDRDGSGGHRLTPRRPSTRSGATSRTATPGPGSP